MKKNRVRWLAIACVVAVSLGYIYSRTRHSPGTSLGQGPPRQVQPLVTVQPHGSRPPFFCVHSIGGNLLNLQPLAARLGPDQPLYGLQARGLDGAEAPHVTIESMASDYVAQVRKVQPEGPYFLGGFSFGGVVAFEMARQLSAAGHKIGLLVLLDSPPPVGSASVSQVVQERGVRDGLVPRLQRHARSLSERDWPGRAAYVQNLLRDRFLFYSWLARYRTLTLLGRKIPPSMYDVGAAQWVAFRDYAPKPYSGSAVLIRSGLGDAGDSRRPEGDWNPWLTGGLNFEQIAGGHEAILQEPYVAALAEKLAHWLEQKRLHVAPPDS